MGREKLFLAWPISGRCQKPVMAFIPDRSDEGDQGLNEGDSSKLQKAWERCTLTTYWSHSGWLFYTHWYTKYGIVHFVLKVVDSQNFFKMMKIFTWRLLNILINSADTDEMPLFWSSLFAKVPRMKRLSNSKVDMWHVCVYHCIFAHEWWCCKCSTGLINIRLLFVFIGPNLVGSLPVPCGKPPFSI